MLAPYMWFALSVSMALQTLSLWFVPRDFSGNDGGADDRKFPIA